MDTSQKIYKLQVHEKKKTTTISLITMETQIKTAM